MLSRFDDLENKSFRQDGSFKTRRTLREDVYTHSTICLRSCRVRSHGVWRVAWVKHGQGHVTRLPRKFTVGPHYSPCFWSHFRTHNVLAGKHENENLDIIYTNIWNCHSNSWWAICVLCNCFHLEEPQHIHNKQKQML